MILLSDHRLLYLVKSDLFGGWQVDWTYRWCELKTIKSTDRGVEITLESKEGKRVLGLFGSHDSSKKLILVPQKIRRDKLVEIMNELKSNDQN